MSSNGVQILSKLVTEDEDVFMLKLGADPPANVKSLFIKMCDGAEPAHTLGRKCSLP
jgi:hypothetical protein